MKDPKMVEAGRKAWVTRREQEKAARRSAASHKAWATRRGKVSSLPSGKQSWGRGHRMAVVCQNCGHEVCFACGRPL